MCFKDLNRPFRLGVQMHLYIRVEKKKKCRGSVGSQKEFFKLKFKKRGGGRKSFLHLALRKNTENKASL